MTIKPDDFTSAAEPRAAAEVGVRAELSAASGTRRVGCSATAPSGVAFGASSANVDALDAALSQLAVAEKLARESEAFRVNALAEIDRVARLEAAAEPGRRSGHQAVEDSLAYRAARADAAVMLHLSEQTVAHHLSQAATLTNSYAETVASLASGAISLRHAAVIVEAGHVIGDPGENGTSEVAANLAAYEEQVLAYAVAVTPPQLRPIARRIAESYAFEDLDTRYERARKDRKVWLAEHDDGLAEVGALLPAHEAFGIFSRLTQMAKRAQAVDLQTARDAKAIRDKLLAATPAQGTGTTGASGAAGADGVSGANGANGVSGAANAKTTVDLEAKTNLRVPFSPLAVGIPQRTRGEIRADLFGDLLLNGTGDTATGGNGTGVGIAGVVQVITHANHLESPGVATGADSGAGALNHIEHPLPEMEGYGPVPVSVARDIASAVETWNKVSVSLATGTVLTVETYRPNEAIRRFLTARDQRCRFPGCRVPVHRCDFDHTVDAALGGPTSTRNLGALCRGHHILKHHTGWSAEQQPDGDFDWTSPTGRTHTDTPISRVLFRPTKIVDAERRSQELQGTAPPISEADGRDSADMKSPEAEHPF